MAGAPLQALSNSNAVTVQELINVAAIWQDAATITTASPTLEKVLTYRVRNTGNGIESFSVGVNLFKNLWLSAGYNFAGYEDNVFSAAGYTSRGPYAKLRFKFDSGTTKDVAAWWEKTRNSLAVGRNSNPADS